MRSAESRVQKLPASALLSFKGFMQAATAEDLVWFWGLGVQGLEFRADGDPSSLNLKSRA